MKNYSHKRHTLLPPAVAVAFLCAGFTGTVAFGMPASLSLAPESSASTVGVVAAAGGVTGPVDGAGIGDPSHLFMMIVYITIAIGFSFLCSVAEAVVLSLTPSYVASLEGSEKRGARWIKRMKTDIDKTLAAILTLNTIAHTVGAGGAGAEAAAYFGPNWVGVSMGVLTLLILFLSEILPKTIGAVYWRQLARPTATFVRVLSAVLFPLIYVSELMTKLLTKGKQSHAVSREELTALAEMGERSGRIDAQESTILRNLFQFSEFTVNDIMTPRTVMFLLPQDMTISQVLQQHSEMSFSRIPIYGENRDDIRGFVLKYDILLAHSRNEGETPIKELAREIKVTRSDTPLTDALNSMLNDRAHIMLVVDPYGGTAGLVSLEDIVETLIGMEIVDEADSATDMRVVARRKWKARMEKLGVVIDEPSDELSSKQSPDES